MKKKIIGVIIAGVVAITTFSSVTIIDSGNTLSRLLKVFESRKPKTLTICTLLDKPDRRVVDDVVVDYTGFVIPDKFVVGFGLDYDQRFRNLPYIGFVEGELE